MSGPRDRKKTPVSPRLRDGPERASRGLDSAHLAYHRKKGGRGKACGYGGREKGTDAAPESHRAKNREFKKQRGRA